MNRRDFIMAATAASVLTPLPSQALSTLPDADLPLHDAPGYARGKTLAQMAEAVIESDPGRAELIETLAQSSDLLAALSFIDVVGGDYTYVGEGQLPGVAFFGEPFGGYYSGAGVVNPRVEHMVSAGFDADSAEGRPLPLAERMEGKKASLSLTRRLLTEAEEPGVDWHLPGMRYRALGSQHLMLLGTERLRLEGDLDRMIGLVDEPTHLLMHKRLRNMLIVSGPFGSDAYVIWDKDEYGVRAAYYVPRTGPYRGRKLRILVTNHDENDEALLGFDTADYGGELFVLSLTDSGIVGFQSGAPVRDDLGTITSEAGTVRRSRNEWRAAIGYLSGRCIAKISGIPPLVPVRA